MRRDTALRVHHMELAMVASGVGGGYRGYDISRGRALFQKRR